MKKGKNPDHDGAVTAILMVMIILGFGIIYYSPGQMKLIGILLIVASLFIMLRMGRAETLQHEEDERKTQEKEL